MNLRYGLLVLLPLYVAIANAAQYVAGDVAPKGAPDGQLNAGDLVVLERMILGDLIPSTIEQVIGDIAPLNAPDSTLNAADLLILQRAILGEITLAPITIGPPSPTLDPVTSPTSLNPYQITGTATANTTVNIYVEGNLQHEITSAADGTFTVDIYLFDGNNNIYATEFDGSDESEPSEIKQVNYVNTTSRTQGDATSDGPISVDTVWTPGIPVQPYNITSNLTVNAGITLVIQPGTILTFDDGTSLNVNGELHVSNAGGQVIFTSSSSNPTAGSWAGLVINNGANNVLIDNALIEWSTIGVWLRSGVADVSISNSSILNTNSRGIYVDGAANTVIDNVLITDASKGVEITSGSANTLVTNSIFQNISQEGIYFFNVGGTANNNTIDFTSNAISIRSASPIIQNNFLRNSGNGIWMYANSAVVAPEIKGNAISNNTNGITIIGGFQLAAPIIDSGNRITDNNIGITIGDDNGIGTVNPQINNNEIHSNSVYNIQAGRDGDDIINATGNWWGSVVISNIAAKIYDYTDALDQRVVDYSGFLDAPNGNPVPGNYLPQIISGNIPLTSGVPYKALGDVRVESGATLSIEPGVILQFGSSMDLLVEGTLDVNGTPQNPVVFTSSNPIPAAGDWGGIKLETLSTNSIIDGAVIEYAVHGVEVKATSNDSVITNSVIRDNNTSGIYFNLAGGAASNNVISGHTIQSTAAGILVQKASPLIDDNIIYNNKYGIYVYISSNYVPADVAPQIINNSISNNVDGIYLSRTTAQISGNVITNNSSNGIWVVSGEPIINLGNIITNNNFGIYLRSDTTAVIDGNIIVENNYGIFIDAGGSVLLQPTITNNDIFDNIVSSMHLREVPGTVALNISNNWWGTDVLLDIRATFSGFASDLISLVPLTSIATTANNAVVLPRNMVISQQYISPSISPGSQDANDLTADIGESANWTVDVRDNANQTVRTFTGTGTSINESWDGKNTSAQYVADGTYVFAISINGTSLNQIPFTVDNTLPQAVIVEPLSNTTVSVEPLLVNGSAYDLNLTNYTFEVADGFTPLEVDYREIITSNTNIINNTLLSWVFNALQEVQGDKTLRLTVTDAAGNVSQSMVQLTLFYPSITNVSHDVYSISPTDGEILTVSIDLGLPATVYLRFYPENDATQNNLIAEVSQVFATAGTKDISWDGMSTVSTNPFVPDGAYRFELFAQSASSVSVFNRADLLPISSTCTQYNAGNVNTGQNKHLTFTCTASQPVIVKFDSTPIYKAIDIGTHPFSWDMRDNGGKILDGAIILGSYSFSSLRKDSVIVEGNIPVVTGVGMAPSIEVIATPHTVFHSFEQVSQIVYRIDQDADVSIKLLKPCYSSDDTCTIDHDDASAITLFDGVLQAKDGFNQSVDHSFEWRGYDFNAATIDANDILVNEEGYFTFSIKATSSATSLSTTYRGSIYLGK